MASIELGQPDGAQPDGAQPSIPDDGSEPDRIIVPVNGGRIPVKRSDEVAYLQFDWTEALPEGVTLQSVEHSVPGAIVREDQGNDSSTSDLDVSGGSHGALFQLTIVATLSDASTLTRIWPLRVFNS